MWKINAVDLIQLHTHTHTMLKGMMCRRIKTFLGNHTEKTFGLEIWFRSICVEPEMA